MVENIERLKAMFRGMWRYRWFGLGVSVVFGLIGGIVVAILPNKYEATARVYVDTSSMLKPLMSGLAVPTNIDSQVYQLSRRLITRPNIEKLVRMSDLDIRVKTKQERDLIVDDLLKDLQLRYAGGDNIYSLAYRHNDPETARKVVDSLLRLFSESGYDSTRKDQIEARKFVDEQISQYEKKLASAENKLKEFKLKNQSISDSNAFTNRLGEVSGLLAQSRLELKEAENYRDALKRQISGEEAVLIPEGPATNNPSRVVIPEIDARIESQKKQLDALLQKFTDAHPDVIGTRRVIDQLEQQKALEIKARKLDKTEVSNANNPVFQQLKLSLAEVEAQVASLKARTAEYQNRYDQLRGAVQAVPELEEQFIQLNRDYGVNKRNYEQLIQKRESIAITNELEATGSNAEFRPIDPPRVGAQPVAPNRPLLLAAALGVSLALGLLMTFVRDQLRPTFCDTRTLREVTGVPLLGQVSMLVDDIQKTQARRGLVAFSAAASLFISAYGIGIAYFVLKSMASI